MKEKSAINAQFVTEALHERTTWKDMLKYGYSEKATKFEKIFHLKFDATQ